MKKTYIKPSAVVIRLEAESLLAASEISLNPDKEVNTGAGGDEGQLGRDGAGSPSNVWEQGW